MEEWHLTESDLKKYPHFDPLITALEAEAYATDQHRVARHAFFPFIQYSKRWARFRKGGQKRPPKVRPIRYAARQDAYIFSYYRHILSHKYEAELLRLGISESVLAYRHLRKSDGQGGKCNVHFACDAFRKVMELGDCCAIALDVSSYFESLDHHRLKGLWCRMLGVTKLPTDHFQVFKAITKYSWVDKLAVYERLGHFGQKKVVSRNPIKGYLTPYNKIPSCLCSGSVFREKIAGGGADRSIIKWNQNSYGIPQGAPISDLLANLYLIDFDKTVAGWVRKIGGAYFRYSDDILILAPGGAAMGQDLMGRARALIGDFGDKLQIKKEKSSLIVFRRHGAGQEFELLDGVQGENGLEYLGFRFDGKRAYLRDATLSNLHRKIVRSAHAAADACAKRYPDKNAAALRKLFDFEKLIRKFGRVEEFGEVQREKREWTFWTYARRASGEFGALGKPILRQLRNHRDFIRTRADQALESAVVRRERRKCSRIA